jgi:hypothetical protein
MRLTAQTRTLLADKQRSPGPTMNSGGSQLAAGSSDCSSDEQAEGQVEGQVDCAEARQGSRGGEERRAGHRPVNTVLRFF